MSDDMADLVSREELQRLIVIYSNPPTQDNLYRLISRLILTLDQKNAELELLRDDIKVLFGGV